jgi:chemotaxis methyl-accepting protein methylase
VPTVGQTSLLNYKEGGCLSNADGQEAHMISDDNSAAEVTRKEMDAVIAVMRRVHGLDVSCYDAAFLAKSTERRRMAATGENLAAYLERLAGDCTEAEAFCRSLRIVYSEFFRNPIAFALLEQLVLPGLLALREQSGGGVLRIWSAGCAGGQEAWSVAILLDEMATGGRAYRIFATDLSESDLALGRSGVYPAAALRNVRLHHLDAYFFRRGDAYALTARLRDRVDFSVYDLLDKGTTSPPCCIYGEFDLVLCSNVLIYYRPQAQRLILDKVRRSLAPGGYLLTGETERQIVERVGGFRAVAPPAALFQAVSEMKGG